MDDSLSLRYLTETGHELMLTKYFSVAITAFVLYEYLLTFPDEVRYVWGGRKSWIFYLFLYNRYTPIVFKLCSRFSYHRSEFSQEECNKTAFLALIFIVMSTLVTQIFLTLRLYALSQRSRPSLVFFSTLSLAQLIFGLAMASSPSNSGMEFPDVPLDAFHLCVVRTKAAYEVGYAGFSLVFDLATFAMIVHYAIRSKSQYGMSHIIKRILEDTTIYFFVMAMCHLVLVLFVILEKATVKLLPATGSIIVMPVLVTRLVLSLKKAADQEVGVEWQVEHFTTRSEQPPTLRFRSLSFELRSRARSSICSRRLDRLDNHDT